MALCFGLFLFIPGEKKNISILGRKNSKLVVGAEVRGRVAS